MSPKQQRRLAFSLGALWPGLGQLVAGRSRSGAALGLGALGLGGLALSGRLDPAGPLAPFAESAALGWLVLWVCGLGHLLAALVVGPARRERSARLLRAGVAYLLRGDLPRASEALDRSVCLGGGPAASLYLAEVERAQGEGRRAKRRLAALAGDPAAQPWLWEITRARM